MIATNAIGTLDYTQYYAVSIYIFAYAYNLLKKKVVPCVIFTGIPPLGTLLLSFFSCIVCHFFLSYNFSISFSYESSAPNSINTQINPYVNIA
jgi:hypothetical protein